MNRNFLSLKDLSSDSVNHLIELGIDINKDISKFENKFIRKCVGLYFKASSTRTRTAFTVGAQKLGAKVIAYGPRDLQITTGENFADTGLVLSNFLDAFVVRTNEKIDDLKQLATQNTMAVINAMTECEHPSQVIGDMVAIHEALGKLKNIHIAYYGEGNNTVAALALIVSKLSKIKLTIITPQTYGLKEAFLNKCMDIAKGVGSSIKQVHDYRYTPKDVDVVYTTRWETMGLKHSDPKWINDFKNFQVNSFLINTIKRNSKSRVIFMHDLPAVRGHEVTAEVVDGDNSIAFRQAYHKLTGSMAIYNWIWGF